MTMRKLLDLTWLGLVLFLAVGAVATLWWPWGRDQSAMAFIGHLIVEGKMPYRDAMDINSPGGYLLHALLEKVVGPARWPLRLMDLGLLLSASWALFALGKALHSPRAGRWAAVIFVLSYWSTGFWNTAQRDGWAAMLFLWGLTVTCAGSGPSTEGKTRWGPLWARAGTAGLLVGLATLMKPLYVVLALPMGVWVVEQWRPGAQASGQLEDGNTAPLGPGRYSPWAALTAGLLGLVLPLGAVLVWLARGGALRPAYEQVVLFNRQVYASASTGQVGLPATCLLFVDRLAQQPILVLLALAGAGYLLGARVRGRWAVAVAWPIVATAILLYQRRLFPYQWHSLTLWLSLLGGIGLAEIMFTKAPELVPSMASSRPWVRRVALLALIPLLFLPVLRTARSVKWWGSDIIVRRDYARYLRHFDQGTDFLPGTNIQVGAYLASHSGPTDTFFQCGLQPDFHLYSGRDPASPVSSWMLATTAASPDLHKKLLGQLMEDLERNRPLYFVVVDKDTNPIMPRTSAQALRDEPVLDRYVRQYYQEEIKIGDCQLLRRRQNRTMADVAYEGQSAIGLRDDG